MSDQPPALRLIGVGMGPGDPDLVTVKAARLLAECDAVVVPVMSAQEQGRAEATVAAYAAPEKIVRTVLALSDRGGVTAAREQAWDDAAAVVLGLFDQGARQVAFATIGDPNVYSTFTYIAETVRQARAQVQVETIPGITAMQDLASRSGTVLCEGREPLTLIPMTAPMGVLETALSGPGSVALYKGWRKHGEVLAALEYYGRLDQAVLGSALGLPGELIVRLGEAGEAGAAASGDGASRAGAASGVSLDNDPLGYLSTVLIPARRERRGGKL